MSRELNIIKHRRIWYGISLSLIIPGVIALAVFGLRLGIDFTGGTIINLSTDQPVEKIASLVASSGVEGATTTKTGDGFQVRFSSESQEVETAFKQAGIKISQLEQVGPSVSRDLIINALLSLLVVSVAITLYVAYAFRTVPSPLSFGTVAIIALLHDALLVLALFAFLGKFAGIEVDSFIVTAILTVIGFSVHDTIVVLDRLRENLSRYDGKFEQTVNTSINEVMGRSLNTSITTVLVLMALFLFGGSSTVNFILALLVGMVAGTYSSIFIAAPLLVTLQQWRAPKNK